MIRIATLATLVLALSACAAGHGAKLAQDPAPDRGHRVAQRVCAGCHAVEDTGASPRPNAPAFASLEMRHTASLSGRVAELTRKGHYEMPPLQLRPDEVDDLVSYIASLGPR